MKKLRKVFILGKNKGEYLNLNRIIEEQSIGMIHAQMVV
jgi:hypothetical protein